eukprot:COSAG06_NODE_5057_length_3755_cov_5.493982_3_plen_72_part_00
MTSRRSCHSARTTTRLTTMHSMPLSMKGYERKRRKRSCIKPKQQTTMAADTWWLHPETALLVSLRTARVWW